MASTNIMISKHRHMPAAGASVLYRDQQSYTRRWGVLLNVDGQKALCQDPETGRTFLADIGTVFEVPSMLSSNPTAMVPASSAHRPERFKFSTGELLATALIGSIAFIFLLILATQAVFGPETKDLSVELGRALLSLGFPGVLFVLWAFHANRVQL